MWLELKCCGRLKRVIGCVESVTLRVRLQTVEPLKSVFLCILSNIILPAALCRKRRFQVRWGIPSGWQGRRLQPLSERDTNKCSEISILKSRPRCHLLQAKLREEIREGVSIQAAEEIKAENNKKHTIICHLLFCIQILNI